MIIKSLARLLESMDGVNILDIQDTKIYPHITFRILASSSRLYLSYCSEALNMPFNSWIRMLPTSIEARKNPDMGLEYQFRDESLETFQNLGTSLIWLLYDLNKIKKEEANSYLQVFNGINIQEREERNNMKLENILESAYNLYEKNDYEESLRLYEIFFKNTENLHSSWVGARFRAYKEWYCLSKKYDPAYNALMEIKKRVYGLFKNHNDIAMFSEYARICKVSKQDDEIINVFLELHEKNKHIARKAYNSVESILIQNRQWEICSFYIENSMEKYQTILAQYDELIYISNSGFDGKYNLVYEKEFEKNMQNLIWILKVSSRDTEIDYIMDELKNNLKERDISLSIESKKSNLDNE